MPPWSCHILHFYCWPVNAFVLCLWTTIPQCTCVIQNNKPLFVAYSFYFTAVWRYTKGLGSCHVNVFLHFVKLHFWYLATVRAETEKMHSEHSDLNFQLHKTLTLNVKIWSQPLFLETCLLTFVRHTGRNPRSSTETVAEDMWRKCQILLDSTWDWRGGSGCSEGGDGVGVIHVNFSVVMVQTTKPL